MKKGIAQNDVEKRKTADLTLPKVGDKAPNFTALDQFGIPHTLQEYAGKWVLLFFYPKDDTPGCTKESCLLRDGFPFFETLEAVILGVSIDSVKSHFKFAQKYELPFTLLSDESKEMVTSYGVWGEKTLMGKRYMGTLRTSFLINPSQKVAVVYEKVNPALHANEVLEDLKRLKR
jgi:peroxiredoxin Q/BCP